MASRMSSFVRENRGKFSFYGACFVGIAAFSAKFFPNTYLLENYQNIVQMYRMGAGVPVPKNITERFEEVLKDMQIKEEQKKIFKLFTVNGFDLFRAGTVQARTGAIIGVPKSYTYESSQDIEKDQIIVNQKLVPWNSAAGESLQDAIVMSPKAQKYAFACEIFMSKSLLVYLCCFYPLIVSSVAYTLLYHCNRNLQLSSKKLVVRGSFYSIICLFSIGLWALATDMTTNMYESKADENVCNLGPDYVEGGVEFYNKIAKRNIALRELMGSDGSKVFTALGNDQMLIRQKHLPITVRKSYAEMRLKKLNVMRESE